ncbi:MAG TPA: potassium transporter TrkG [Nitrososphaera sp.]|jgi:trk system potassium uptake protein TrkH|nr:potassium transporter TrkG [Nitrososphaera sp.]
MDFLDKPARSFMTGQFVVIDEGTDVASAVKQMQQQRAESIIVSRRGLAIGILTDDDIIDKVVMKGEDSDNILIKQIMSSPVITISSGSTVKQALQQMRIHRIKRIPLADKEGIVGVVTHSALAGAIRTSVIQRTLKKAKGTIQDQYKPVLGNLGVLLQFSAVLLVVPALVGTLLGEAVSITGIYLEVVGLSFAGFFLMSYGERGQMNLKQASIFVVASFVVMSLFGSLPYVYLNPFIPGIDANSLFVNSLFESASGFTTTGLSMITNPENLPESFSFYRSYTQWVGGMSFVYLVMMLFFPEEKLSAMKSVLGGGMLRFKEFIVTLVGIFSVYTIILVLLTTVSGKTDDFNAISLILSTISGGGFSPTSTIINPDNLEVLTVTSAGMILSALPFAFHYYVFRKKGLISHKSLGSEVTVYLIAMGISMPLLYVLMAGVPGNNIGTAAFHLISASTNTGLQYLNIQAIPVAAKVFLVIVMLVGGCAFSTAGGIKVGRLLFLYQEISRRVGRKPSEPSFYSLTQPAYTSISSTANPQRNSDNGGLLDHLREEYRKRDFGELFQKRDEVLKVVREILGIKLVREILLIIGLYIFVSVLTGAVLSNLTGRSFEDGLFESVSALSTTGLSTGITSLQLDSFSKLMLTANMILGRFEIIAIFYIFFRTLRH